jgi:hypothetical protein
MLSICPNVLRCMCVHVKSMYVLCTAVKATVHLSLTVNLISLHTSAPKYYNRFVFRDRIIIIFKSNLLPSYFYSPVECFLTCDPRNPVGLLINLQLLTVSAYCYIAKTRGKERRCMCVCL